VMEYFDSRGVRRTYNTSLEDGVLRVWRDAEGFDQRLVVKIAPDEFVAVYELAREPGVWKDDLRLKLRRRRWSFAGEGPVSPASRLAQMPAGSTAPVTRPVAQRVGSDWSGLFWSAFRKSRNAMALVDHDRMVVDVNGALVRLLGHKRNEVVGRPIGAFL